MARASRIALRIVGVIALLLVAVVAAVVLLVDDSAVARFAERQVSEATGRPFAIGDLDIDWGWNTRLRASEVRLGNAEWADGPMLAVPSARATLDLAALLRGVVALGEVRVEGGRLNLARSADGRVNWHFPDTTPGAGRAELPVIRQARIDNFTIGYRDPAKESERNLQLATAQLSTDDRQLALRVRGSLDGLPLHGEARGGSIAALRDPERRFPIEGELTINETRLMVDGALTGRGAARAFDARVRLQGPDMGRLFPIAGIPAPPTGPYAMNARVERDGAELAFTGLDLRVGESDLHGRLAVDFGSHPPRLEGRLTGERVDPRDVGLFLVEPDGEETELLPRARIAPRPLEALNMEVQIAVGRLDTPIVPLRNVELVAALHDGRLVLQPMSVGLAGGRVSGRLRVDAVGIPGLGWDLELRGIQVGELLPDLDPLDATRIVVGGNTHLSGRGRTVAAAIGSSDGRLELLATGGQLDALLVEAIGQDVAEALLLLGEEDVGTPVRCAVGLFNIESGIARIETLVVDTRDSVLVVNGLINLRSEVLNLEVVANPKDPSLLALGRPVAVQGPFRSPDISIAGTPGAEVLGAAVLGALFAPAAALLPFLEAGGAEAQNCRALLEQVEAPG